MSTQAAETPQEGVDYTVDPANVQPGTVIFRHGYYPCVVFDVQDGKLEVADFQTFKWEDYHDFSTHRGPRPSSAGPEEPTPSDKVAELQAQVDALTRVLAKLAPEEVEAPAPAADPTPTAVVSPFGGSPTGGFVGGWSAGGGSAA